MRTHIISAHRLPKSSSSSISLRLPKSISVVPTTQKTIKGGPKIIRCTKCKKLFDKQIHLTSHMKYAHPEVWKCDLCDKLFTDEGSLRVHETNIHHVKPYQCSECQKRFSLPFQVRINQFHEIFFRPNSFFCNFKNGQKSIFELGKGLKLPKMPVPRKFF